MYPNETEPPAGVPLPNDPAIYTDGSTYGIRAALSVLAPDAVVHDNGRLEFTGAVPKLDGYESDGAQTLAPAWPECQWRLVIFRAPAGALTATARCLHPAHFNKVILPAGTEAISAGQIATRLNDLHVSPVFAPLWHQGMVKYLLANPV